MLTRIIDSLWVLFFHRPDVQVDVEFEAGRLYLVLSNRGRSPAEQIRVKFGQSLIGVEGNKVVSDQQLFHRLQFLPEGKSIRVFLDTSRAYFAREEVEQFSVSIHFTDRYRRTFQRDIQHNLAVYRDFGYLVE